ncbi:MAG: SusC/RagA family TonB-linked outer membrane protein, partial [bacterium]
MKRKLLLFTVFSLCFAVSLMAQKREVSGTVIDKDGTPLMGVTVIETGTTNGTITDTRGNFTISIDPESKLTFRFVGLATKTVEVTSDDIIVEMEEDFLNLDEVQVVAYGTKTKREISGSISSIDSEVIQSNINTSVISGLTGRSAGIDISNSADGRNASIRVRGVSSLLSSSAPLVVVDGMPSDQGLNDINPQDISSIDVLKDAAASILYGSRAANGVILITTKQGETGKTRVNVNYQHGFLVPSVKDIPTMNAEQWRSVYTTAATNRYGESARFDNPSDGVDGFYSWDQYDSETGELLHAASSFDTDWLGLVMEDNGSFDRLSLSASGGSENTTFYASALYRKDNGYLQATDEQRINFRLNVRHNFNQWLRAGINLSGNFREPDAFSGMGGYKTAQTSALPIYPLMSPSNPNRYWYEFQLAPNFVAEHEYSASFKKNHSFLNSVFLELEPLENLILRSEWQSDYSVNEGQNWSHPYINPPGTGSGGGFGMTTVNKNEGHTWNTNNTAEYKTSLGEHNLGLLIGGNILSGYGGSNTAFQEQIPNTTFTFSNGQYDRLERVASGWGSRRFVSGLTRINYSFKDRYFLEGSYRKDGSSKFGKDMRWGDFAGVSGSWIFSDEDFVDNILPFLYFGRFRASWGEVGNAQTGGDFKYLGTSLTWFNYGGYRGEGFENIGNSSLQWETTKQTDIGVDLALFRGRISLNIDYYHKLSEDLLLSYRIGQFHGYWSSSITQNVGSLQFKGWEYTLRTINFESSRDGFRWITDFNLTTQQSEVLKLSNDAHNIVDQANIAVVGQPLGSYYLTQWAGVHPVTGHELIYDVDPVNFLLNPAATYLEDLTGGVMDAHTMLDGEYLNNRVIDPNKSPYPNFYGGFTNTFMYKGIELSVHLAYQFGNWYYDNMEQSKSYISATSNGSPVLLDGWTRENPTNIPLIQDSPMGGRFSSRFLYDASYIRLRDVSLGYYLPENILSGLNIDKFRIFTKAQNTYLWTRWPGIEPEATFEPDDNISPGI